MTNSATIANSLDTTMNHVGSDNKTKEEKVLLKLPHGGPGKERPRKERKEREETTKEKESAKER